MAEGDCAPGLPVIAFTIAWAGYLLMWYGWELIKGPGVGILDLAVPGRIPKPAP